jgi:ribosome-binding protein aMBF1 (putative translation factor)
MDDEDWDFKEDSYEYRNYESSGHDLSDEINKGHRIFDLRSLLNMSIESLSALSAISVQNLLAIEAGLLHLDRATAESIANAMDIELSDIWLD